MSTSSGDASEGTQSLVLSLLSRLHCPTSSELAGIPLLANSFKEQQCRSLEDYIENSIMTLDNFIAYDKTDR